jgi:uncharacterized protein YydD (DUF2326 family)
MMEKIAKIEIEENIEELEDLKRQIDKFRMESTYSLRKFPELINEVESTLRSIESARRIQIGELDRLEKELAMFIKNEHEIIEKSQTMKDFINLFKEMLNKRDVILAFLENELEFLHVVYLKMKALINTERDLEREIEGIKAYKEIQETYKNFYADMLNMTKSEIAELVDFVKKTGDGRLKEFEEKTNLLEKEIQRLAEVSRNIRIDIAETKAFLEKKLGVDFKEVNAENE